MNVKFNYIQDDKGSDLDSSVARMVEQEGNRHNGQLMRIGDLAKKAGTTMRTVRYYEQLGLIAPAARTRGGFRLYEENELRRLRLIKILQMIETPLAQVKALFDWRQHGKAASDIAANISQLLEGQLQEVEQRIAQFRVTQASLRETIEILRSCCRCSREPGPEVCSHCPAITSRTSIPLHMRAVIESTRPKNHEIGPHAEGDGDPLSVPTQSGSHGNNTDERQEENLHGHRQVSCR